MFCMFARLVWLNFEEDCRSYLPKKLRKQTVNATKDWINKRPSLPDLLEKQFELIELFSMNKVSLV